MKSEKWRGEKISSEQVRGIFLVAGVGFEPHDLRVMSPTSYQAALPRDMELLADATKKMVPEAGIEPVRDSRLTGF